MSKKLQHTIVSVVGARPNFMKLVPLDREIRERDSLRHVIVHTGQHYDREMSNVFFDELKLPAPDWNLGVGSGGHGKMTGTIMIEFEKVCLELKPDLVVVVGDVNSTIAAALVARKLGVPVAHVEAGLRSFDETMPEELNRRLTDTLSNLLFVPEAVGVRNLEREGIEMGRVHLVGDIMLETLALFLPAIRAKEMWKTLDLEKGSYGLVTIHRPSNVDDPHSLTEVIDILESLPFPAVFPIHPRTLGRIDEFGFSRRIKSIRNLHLIPPQSYIDFLSLLYGGRMTLSDSGSVQSEASFFDVPCLVCRENTERPLYHEQGTCVLVRRNRDLVRRSVDLILMGQYPKSTPLVRELGSRVAQKVVKELIAFLKNHVRSDPIAKTI